MEINLHSQIKNEYHPLVLASYSTCCKSMALFANNDKKDNIIIGREMFREKFEGACKYSPYCRYFQESSCTCLNDDQASSDCGTYDQFDNFILDKNVTKINK